MTQFYNLTKALAASIFKAPTPILPDGALPADSEQAELHAKLRAHFDAGEYTEADALVRTAYDKEKPVMIAVAIDLYARLSQLDEEALKVCDFSVEKIGEGLRDLMNFYEIKAVKRDPNAKMDPNMAPVEGKPQMYNIAKLISGGIFHKPTPIIGDDELPADHEQLPLLKELHAMIEEHRYCDADARVREEYDKKKPVVLAVALDMYARLAEIAPEELTAHDYSVKKIDEGLRDLVLFYEVKIQNAAPEQDLSGAPDPTKSKYYNLTKFLAAQMFKKPSPIIPDGALPANSEAGIVWVRLRQLLDMHKVNTAENLLFDSFDKEKPIYAAIALDFYARVAEMDEDILRESNFSEEEIGDGIRDMMKYYNIKIVMKKPEAKPAEDAPAAEAPAEEE
ncbi:MAG: hypothetical protein E7632_03115 [Ruminococcaceae bacterium]|nr:hypothetical protein [Oscillospiraceae bacterium]